MKFLSKYKEIILASAEFDHKRSAKTDSCLHLSDHVSFGGGGSNILREGVLFNDYIDYECVTLKCMLSEALCIVCIIFKTYNVHFVKTIVFVQYIVL